MQPLHFGTSRQPLFGMYHPAAATARPGPATVLCQPLGHEYLRAHRAFRNLAVALAQQGCHVLRFDYYGSGDSAGSGEDTTIDRCLRDIGTAIDELKDMTGVPRVSLVGLRVGGTLAALSAAGRRDVDRLVLWDPVVSGADYLEELAKLQREWLVDRMGPRAPVPDESAELIGFPLTGEAREQIRQMTIVPMKPTRARAVSLLVSEERAPYHRLRRELEALPAPFTYSVVAGDGAWRDGERIHQTLLPHAMVRAITAAACT
jgi:pimeloyl-ACP methyl ester carboxylesterase